MKRVLFLTTYPSPYRVHFFDCLARTMDVTVLFSDRAEEKTHRDAAWFVSGENRFRKVQLGHRIARVGTHSLCLDVLKFLNRDYDAIVICGYSSPTAILAIYYLRLRGRSFYMEVDGGLIREDSPRKYRFKRSLVSSARYWISSGEKTTDYLVHYGARREDTFVYPFTSLWQSDILSAPPTREEKAALRRELGLPQGKLLLYVGRFTRAKGMDDLLEAAPLLDRDIGICFVGGEPSEAHLAFCKEHELKNVHFVGFRKTEELARYYRACDALALPTKSDVWGLVLNEAMACGLPVITTDRCGAGLELIRDGVNGYLVPVADQSALVGRLRDLFAGDYRQMGAAALETIRPYTLENMASAHAAIFEREG